ncbi:hypothetical protein N7508_003712 [Penicillium antarcticum]|uniref:uncharacterized protein n=1 Tax=Penicillium antarcticum TaxID=416450 RepID=UPI002383C327|nr:uncharacterized protein N7508_003712 [Penicillium antarcticum]KAJ5312882.1 hypothetical protein N7508_003712 [Penicillium antarcticum]
MHNLKVPLLEATDRIGGRTWTTKVLGEDLEMGGTWLHWGQPHLYGELHRFFTLDDHDSRTLMPFPYEPFREPASWRKYDHWSVKDRLDRLDGFSRRERDLFESSTGTFGSAPGKDTAFTEALRWYALGGYKQVKDVRVGRDV